MINLTKNELTKIFHKKAIYVVLIITIAFSILNIIMTKFFENQTQYYYNDDVEFYEEQLKMIDKKDPNYKEMYISLNSELELAKLQKKYDEESWQKYIIASKAQELIYNMISAEGTEKYEEIKKEYDKFIERLNKNDWKAFAEEEIESLNLQIKELEMQMPSENAAKMFKEIQIKDLNDQKQVLQWRIQKDIPFGISSNKNMILEQWYQRRRELLGYIEQEKVKPLTYDEKYSKQEAEQTVALTEYAINKNDEKIALNNFNNRTNLATLTDGELVDTFSKYMLFIIIVIVIVAGTTVSEEFNKGTIKLLLVRPHKRTKILIAKFLACLIILVLAYISVALLQFVVGGIMYGFNNYTGEITIYNFKTSLVETIGTFKYLLLSGIAILPKYILFMTLAFSISVILVNSPLAIAIPLLGMMGEDIINELAYNYEKAKFLRFFVTPNWNMSIYLFGKMPEFEPISVPFSLFICILYFVIMVAINIIVFKRKEIKNI